MSDEAGSAARRPRALWLVWAAGALAIALSACSTLPATDRPGERLAGRLSVKVDGDAARSFSAAFELNGSADRGEMALTTPLGTQVARADWSAERVRLQTQEGERFYADLDSLAADALGERVPLAALFDWLRGRPWRGAPSSPIASGFEQLGWAVDVSRVGAGSIEARRAALPVVTVRARLDD